MLVSFRHTGQGACPINLQERVGSDAKEFVGLVSRLIVERPSACDAAISAGVPRAVIVSSNLEDEFQIPCAHRRLRLPGIAGEVATSVDTILQSLGVYPQKMHVLGEMNKTIACSIAKAKRNWGPAPAIALEEGMRGACAGPCRRATSPHRRYRSEMDDHYSNRDGMIPR